MILIKVTRKLKANIVFQITSNYTAMTQVINHYYLLIIQIIGNYRQNYTYVAWPFRIFLFFSFWKEATERVWESRHYRKLQVKTQKSKTEESELRMKKKKIFLNAVFNSSSFKWN